MKGHFNFKQLFDMYAERDAILANNYGASDLVKLTDQIHSFHHTISNYFTAEECKELYNAYMEGKGSVIVSPREELTQEQIADLDNTSLSELEKDIFGKDI